MSAAGRRPVRWRRVAALARKDLTAVRRSPALTLPMVIVPLIFLLVLPLGAGLALRFAPLDAASGGALAGDLIALLERAPAGLQASLAGLEVRAQLLVLALGYLFAPMFLILPLMVASILAADSVAGERERGTLEALLHTPLDDRELFLGKLAGSWLPAVAVSLVGFVVYTLVVDAVAWPVLGRPLLPNGVWFALVVWVAPAAAALALGVTVLVSARVATVQAAYQLGAIVVLPAVALLVAQATGAIYLNLAAVLVLGAALWAIDLVLLRAGYRAFRRDALGSRG